MSNSIKGALVALIVSASPVLAQEGGAYGAFADVAVRDLVGRTVMSNGGESLGEVERLVRVGADVQAVLGIGGFLGFGEHDVAVPLTELLPVEGAVMLPNMGEDVLREMPGYVPEEGSEELAMDVTVSGDPAPAPAADDAVVLE